MNNIIPRFEPHSHSDYSNLRLLDSINRVPELIKRAQEIGLKGIALTDHESLSGHIKANKLGMEILKDNPEFKVALGNEIYLCPDRSPGQRYYHFILIAKNEQGHKALRELSSRAWMNSYVGRGMTRVPTTYSDLEEIVNKYPNTLIATTACLGGELSVLTMELIDAEILENGYAAKEAHAKIVEFMQRNIRLFGGDFYIEIAPGQSKEQIAVNIRLKAIAKAFGVKMVVGSDAHYLKKEDRYVHKAYLNSKGGEREVDAFYEYCYLQDQEQEIENLSAAYSDINFIYSLFENSMKIYDKIENYSLLHKQTIPTVTLPYKDYIVPEPERYEKYPALRGIVNGNDDQSKFWLIECAAALKRKGLDSKEEYWARLDEEAHVNDVVGEKLETNMYKYPVTLQHYVNLFWECGSTVGAGRGSSCSGLNHYLLGITQLDPIKWSLPYWRYSNVERLELGDIDLDLSPSRRPLIIQKIKEERGKNFYEGIDDLSRKNLGATLVATFGTETTKSSILTACRGYRSEDYPDGIDSDTAQYMTSLIPQERGFLWSINDVVYGNKEKGRKPVQSFINELNSYPGLAEILFAIEGLISQRGSHASGVIFFDEDPYEFGCFMTAPNGDITTQYDLHDAEAAGLTKYDMLVTDVQDKLSETVRLLQKYGEIDPNLTMREAYEKYFHPEVLPINEGKYWDAVSNNSVLNIFQFDSDVGSQAAKKIKPRSILELSDSNGLMRLMTQEKGEETPMDKYIRFKNDLSLWYKEMDKFGLTKQEQKVLEKHFKESYGVPPSQEQLMTMLMDKDICNFTLAGANSARKVVGRKQMDKIPELKAKILKQAKSQALGQYVWSAGVGPQMGYAFSKIHSLAYSFIGFQTVFAAVNWNPIYWNTACLIVNSGALENAGADDEKQTDYAKLATAIGDIRSRGIKVSLIDINNSEYSFIPDVPNNEILFGMKALRGVNSATIDMIIGGRPYTSIKDFMLRCPLGKSAMISLIKGGAFDKLDEPWAKMINHEERIPIMGYYLSQVCEPKKRITLQNFNGLMTRNLLPEELSFQKRVFVFNSFLKKNQKVGQYYVFNESCEKFYREFFSTEYLDVINGIVCILQKDWDKLYKNEMATARDWMKANQQETLTSLNKALFKETWDKYAKGTVSTWEMESLCFYYHDHELAKVNTDQYGVVDFFSLSRTPQVERTFSRNGMQIPLYKTEKIIGTVISKNDAKASIALLTTTGVVTVKFTKEYYAMFKRQISKRNEKGAKKVIEAGWMTKGTMLLINGFRRDDMFVAKKYKHNKCHQLYKITAINGTEIEIQHERAQGDENEED